MTYVVTIGSDPERKYEIIANTPKEAQSIAAERYAQDVKLNPRNQENIKKEVEK